MALTALFGFGKSPSIDRPVVVDHARTPPPGSPNIEKRAEQKASAELDQERRRRRGRAQTILTGARGQLASESNIKRPALGAPS